METPLVSVVVPNYNHGKFLFERLESILNQTFSDFELIILDDYSSDNSREIIEKYRANNKVSHILYNNVNSGNPFLQWEKGIAVSRGKYIWIAESDDFADVEFLSILIEIMEKNEEVGLAYCKSYLIDSSNNYTKYRGQSILPDESISLQYSDDYNISGIDEITRHLLKDNMLLNASCIVFRKQNFIQTDNYYLKFRLCGDWIKWIQILSDSKIYFYSTKPLNYFRFHENTARSKTSEPNFVSEYFLIVKYLIGLGKTEINIHRRELMDSLSYRLLHLSLKSAKTIRMYSQFTIFALKNSYYIWNKSLLKKVIGKQ